MPEVLNFNITLILIEWNSIFDGHTQYRRLDGKNTIRLYYVLKTYQILAISIMKETSYNIIQYIGYDRFFFILFVHLRN